MTKRVKSGAAVVDSARTRPAWPRSVAGLTPAEEAAARHELIEVTKARCLAMAAKVRAERLAAAEESERP